MQLRSARTEMKFQRLREFRLRPRRAARLERTSTDVVARSNYCIGASPVASSPYQERLYSAMTSQGVVVEALSRSGLLRARYDIAHVHWEHLLIDPSRGRFSATTWLASLSLAKLRGVIICYTLHNIRPHDYQPSRYGNLYRRMFDTLVDGIITHGDAAIGICAEERQALADKPFAVIPHGPLESNHAECETDTQVKVSSIPDDLHVILSFGAVKPYKGHRRLIKEFMSADIGNDVHLHIAGSCSDVALREFVKRSAADSNGRISASLDRIPEDEIGPLLSRCAGVILSYEEIHTSGVALLALSHSVRVIAPRIGLLPDLADAVGPGWVILYDPPLDGEALSSTIDQLTLQPLPAVPPILATWVDIADSTIAFFLKLEQRKLMGT